MDSIYLVLRSFKDQGNLFEAGTVIADLSSVRLFRSRLGCRDIIELQKDQVNNKTWLDYLNNRGATVDQIAKDFINGTKAAAKVLTPVAAKIETPVKTVTAPVKPVAKATTVKATAVTVKK